MHPTIARPPRREGVLVLGVRGKGEGGILCTRLFFSTLTTLLVQVILHCFFFDDMISAGMGYISTAAGPGQGQEPDSRFPGALRRTCPVRTQ